MSRPPFLPTNRFSSHNINRSRNDNHFHPPNVPFLNNSHSALNYNSNGFVYNSPGDIGFNRNSGPSIHNTSHSPGQNVSHAQFAAHVCQIDAERNRNQFPPFNGPPELPKKFYVNSNPPQSITVIHGSRGASPSPHEPPNVGGPNLPVSRQILAPIPHAEASYPKGFQSPACGQSSSYHSATEVSMNPLPRNIPYSLCNPPPVCLSGSAVIPPSIPPLHLPPPNFKCGIPFGEYNAPAGIVPTHGSSSKVPQEWCEKASNLSQFISRFSVDDCKKIRVNNVQVPEFRSVLLNCILVFEELQVCKNNLQCCLESDKSIWNNELNRSFALKAKLSQLSSYVSDPQRLQSVLKKLQIIKKKREQRKKTKLNQLLKRQQEEQLREERSLKIDKWLENLKEKNLKEKREAEMKKEADNILMEVRKKIHEAKKAIEKIKVFEKLRNSRQANAVQKGLHIMPEHIENFEKKITILKKLMLHQLEDYEAEERAMKVMLETEQEGQREEEDQWKLQKLKAVQKKEQKNILDCLFGDSEEPTPTDPLYLFHLFQTSGTASIENLVNIRCQWDVYLQDDGDAIPQKWVTPCPPSDFKWEAFT